MSKTLFKIKNYEVKVYTIVIILLVIIIVGLSAGLIYNLQKPEPDLELKIAGVRAYPDSTTITVRSKSSNSHKVKVIVDVCLDNIKLESTEEILEIGRGLNNYYLHTSYDYDNEELMEIDFNIDYWIIY